MTTTIPFQTFSSMPPVADTFVRLTLTELDLFKIQTAFEGGNALLPLTIIEKL